MPTLLSLLTLAPATAAADPMLPPSHRPGALRFAVRSSFCGVVQGWHAHVSFWSWSAITALGFGEVCSLLAYHAALAAAAWLLGLAEAQKAGAVSGGFDGNGGQDDDSLHALVDGVGRDFSLAQLDEGGAGGGELAVPAAAAAFWGDFFWAKFCAAVLPCAATLWLALRFVMLAHHVAHSVVRAPASRHAF